MVVINIKPINKRGVVVVEINPYFSKTHNTRQPRIAPAVPGAKGEYPTPNAVVMSL